MKNQAFTLIEILVVVLIIAILAAIAVPQYQKAVMKANLHKGVSLVESIYQAQQVYYLANGDFTRNFENLDVSIPLNNSCEKYEEEGVRVGYICDFGRISINDSYTDIGYVGSDGQISYWHFWEDKKYKTITFKAGKRYCFAQVENKIAQDVCLGMGGKLTSGESNLWKYYKLD